MEAELKVECDLALRVDHYLRAPYLVKRRAGIAACADRYRRGVDRCSRSSASLDK
jgi:ribosomal 50S subunit-recycling heat shock protein